MAKENDTKRIAWTESDVLPDRFLSLCGDGSVRITMIGVGSSPCLYNVLYVPKNLQPHTAGETSQGTTVCIDTTRTGAVTPEDKHNNTKPASPSPGDAGAKPLPVAFTGKAWRA